MKIKLIIATTIVLIYGCTSQAVLSDARLKKNTEMALGAPVTKVYNRQTNAIGDAVYYDIKLKNGKVKHCMIGSGIPYIAESDPICNDKGKPVTGDNELTRKAKSMGY